MIFAATVEGAPRTKKNSAQLIPGFHPRIVPSKAYRTWERSAVPQLRAAWRRAPLTDAVQVSAVFYREKNLGDLCGYLQALGDALEVAGVIANDRQIASWDGSRLAKDAANPRVELTLATLEGT